MIPTILFPHRWQQGKYTSVLEEALANYLSVSHAFAFASEEVALWLTLRGWEIGGGDEVIVSACAPRHVVGAIRKAEAVPRFVDIEEETFNLDAAKFEGLEIGRARVIVVQHVFGQAANLGKIVPWARERKIKVVEDCSQALGAHYRGELLGTFGDVALFSFGRAGSLRALGGGAAVTSDPRLSRALAAARARLSFPSRWLLAKSLFGKSLAGSVPYRLPNIWALAAYRRFVGIDKQNQCQRAVAGYYLQQLRDVPVLKLPRVEEGAEPSFHCFAIRVSDPGRLLRTARRSGIVLARWDWDDTVSLVEGCPVARGVANRVVLLPTAIPLAKAKKIVRVVRAHYRLGADE